MANEVTMTDVNVKFDSIVAAFVDWAKREPDREFLTFEETCYTYGELYQQVKKFSQALQNWGLERGEHVALFLENCPQFVIAYLGIQLAGGVVVLINTQYREVELSHILNDAVVKLCVTSLEGNNELTRLEELAKLPYLDAIVLADSNLATLEIEYREIPRYNWQDWLEWGEQSADTEQTLPQGDDIAVIGYTSGTTGRSKGAMMRHSNLAFNIASISLAWHWSESDNLLLALPLFHTHGLAVGLHGTIWNGAQVDLRRKFEAAEVFAALMSGKYTMFFGVPTLYKRLLAEAGKPENREKTPPPLRLYVSGSAPLSAETFVAFQKRFGQTILERYGMTETAMNLTNPYDGERRAGTVGQPFPGQEARIVDVRTREILPPGQNGEIEVRGPHVFAGYWQRADATAAAFDSEGWFRTGDLGWVSEDGYFTINGRAHELIISGGYNIYPREVEEVIEQHPKVAEVAVLNLPDADFGEQVVAVVVPNILLSEMERSDLAQALVEWCKERLASYKKPRRIVFADKLPRNALGKIQKHLLKEQLTNL